MKLQTPELIALGLAGVAVLLIVKSSPKTAGSSTQAATPAKAAGNAPGLFTNLWDKDWTNDYATQASYTPASMAADPLGLDNNPSNDTGAGMSYAPWYIAERSPW